MQTLIPVIDIETTGLTARDNYILEIAILLVDQNLNEVGRYEQVVGYTPVKISQMFSAADPFVQDMHAENGLWNDCTQAEHAINEVDYLISNWLEETVLEFQNSGHEDEHIELRTMGNSLRLDLNFIEHHLPQLYQLLGYRSVDMSAVEKFMTWFLPGYTVYDKKPSASHRAMADNEMCLEQARSVAQHLAMLEEMSHSSYERTIN